VLTWRILGSVAHRRARVIVLNLGKFHKKEIVIAFGLGTWQLSCSNYLFL